MCVAITESTNNKQLLECSSQRLLLVDRAVNDAVLPYISEKLECMSKKDSALKTRERELENSLKHHGLTIQEGDNSDANMQLGGVSIF